MGGSMSSIVIFGDTSGSITLDTPAVAGTNTITLPANTGTILTTASSINASSVTSGSLPKQQLPTGSILQVVQATKTDTFSTTSTSQTDVTGLSVSITPTSATSKILVFYNVQTSMENFQMALFLVRNSTNIFVGDAAGSRIQATSAYCGVPTGTGNEFSNSQMANSIMYLDSPATTSAITYKIQAQVNSGTGYVNRSYRDDNATYASRVPSSIIVMEVAA